MNIRIRPALENDLPVILDIVNEVIRTSTANYNYDPETLEERRDWLQKKQQSGMPVIVAETDGQTIGFGTYGQFRDRTGYRFTVEHSVYIATPFRSKGVGKRLLETLIQLAKTQGMHIMVAGIDAENTESIAFHRKYGFEPVGHFREIGFKFDRWLDVVFLQLFL